MSANSLYEGMVFNYETTNRTDFRDGEIKPLIKTVYKAKPASLKKRATALKDTHTLTDWKNANMPFDLLIKPKDIVRTNPREVQLPYERLPDLGRGMAQKTRPRLVMTPAVSIDDLPIGTRDLLVSETYKSTTQSAMQEGISELCNDNVRSSFPGLPAPANPITLPKLQPQYVSPEWRMESVSWDARQLRAYCDPTREFYLARDIKCSACEVTAAVEAQKKLAKQMKRR